MSRWLHPVQKENAAWGELNAKLSLPPPGFAFIVVGLRGRIGLHCDQHFCCGYKGAHTTLIINAIHGALKKKCNSHLNAEELPKSLTMITSSNCIGCKNKDDITLVAKAMLVYRHLHLQIIMHFFFKGSPSTQPILTVRAPMPSVEQVISI